MCKLLLFALLLLFFAPSLRAQSFGLDKNPEPVVPLDGLWRFHPGDNPAWASPGFDDSQWPLIRSEEGWTKQGYAGGFAWYRFKLQVPDGSKPLSLLLSGQVTTFLSHMDKLPPEVSAQWKAMTGASDAGSTSKRENVPVKWPNRRRHGRSAVCSSDLA